MTEKMRTAISKWPKWDDYVVEMYKQSPEFAISSLESELEEYEETGICNMY